jgi:hypothetical protein
VLSDELDPAARQAITTLCKEHGPVLPAPAGDEVEAAFLLAVHGVVAVGRCTGYAWPHLAGRALKSARAALAEVLGPLRTQMLEYSGVPRAVGAAWQRRHLAPLPGSVATLVGPTATHA